MSGHCLEAALPQVRGGPYFDSTIAAPAVHQVVMDDHGPNGTLVASGCVCVCVWVVCVCGCVWVGGVCVCVG